MNSLAPLFPDKHDLKDKIGEAWLTGEKCRFADGPFAGRTLDEAWREMPTEWAGTKISRKEAFPLLVKFIFTGEKLSVQVHPDDEYASRHEQQAGGRGKTEMWYCVSARPGAEVLVGLKPGVTRESFRRAIAEGTAEECVERIPLHAGEAIFVPAGTVHTIGPGLVLCEIQEQSDLTYRVYDYNRRNAAGETRPLHIEKAMDVIRFGEQRGGKIQPVKFERGTAGETYFVSCRYFAAEKWEFSDRVAATTSPEHFDLLITLAGRGAIEFGAERIAYAPAQIWFVPAALGKYEIVPEIHSTLLRTYVPAGPDEFARRLTERGVSEAERSRLVYS